MRTLASLTRHLGRIAGVSLLASTSCWALGTAPGNIIATVTGIVGKAQVLKAKSTTWVDLAKDDNIDLGDTIRTQPRGRVRLQFTDRDEARNAGPSTMNVAPGTEIAMKKFSVRFDDPRKSEGFFDLLKGTVRSFMKGWGRNSSFSVRAGVAVCGIRGSESVVSFDGTRAFHSNLSGDNFTMSDDLTNFPGEKALRKFYQRLMTSSDPKTWIDILLSERRRRQLIERTQMPGNNGQTEEDLHEQQYGSGGGTDTGDAGGAGSWMGVEWTADGLPDCQAKVYDLVLNSYPYADIREHRNFTFYRDELINGRFVVSGSIQTDCPGEILGVECSIDGGRSWQAARVNSEALTFRYAFDPTGIADIDLKVRAVYKKSVIDAYRNRGQ